MLIPIGDLNPVRTTPWVMRLLLAANIGVFLLVQPLGEGVCAQQQLFLEWAMIPAEVARGSPLTAQEVAALAPGCDLRTAPDKPVHIAVVVSTFFHADVLHLAGNMLFLWVFGNNVEERFGHLRFLVLYLLFGVVAGIAFAVTNPDSTLTLVGASGAVAGVLGSYLVLHPTARVTVVVVPLLFLALQLPAVLVLGAWFLLQLREVGGDAAAGGGVAYLAHVAGFVAGAAVTLVAGRQPRRRRRHRPRPSP